MSVRLILFSADFVVMGTHAHMLIDTHTYRIQLKETSKGLQLRLVAGKTQIQFCLEIRALCEAEGNLVIISRC